MGTDPKAAFEWAGYTFETSHAEPREAVLLEERSRHGKRRVMIFGDHQYACWRQNKDYNWSTVWHYNEDGTIDGDMTGEWSLSNRAAKAARKAA